MEHNCVIIPKFGGFVGNYKSAQINKLNHKIYPPSKQITFNQNLTQNDGLLYNFIASKWGISYQEAETFCKKEVELWKQNLENGVNLEFYRIGRVFKDSLGNKRFEPSKKFNLLPDAFGLDEIFGFPQIFQKVETKVEDEPIVKTKEIIPSTRQTPVYQLNFDKKKMVAAAAVLVFIIYSLYLSFQTNMLRGGNFHMSELNPFSSKVCEVYSPRVTEVPEVVVPKESLMLIPDSTNYISFSLFNEEEAFLKGDDKVVRLIETKITKVDSTKVVLNKPANTQLPYQIVIGCFSEKANAENLVLKLRNEGYLNAGLIDFWRGLYRVRIDAFEEKDIALAKLSTIKEQKNPGAWIIRK